MTAEEAAAKSEAEAKLLKRAERFGIVPKAPKPTEAPKQQKQPQQQQKQQQQQPKQGKSKQEQQEPKQKAPKVPQEPKPVVVADPETLERMKKRAERFNIPEKKTVLATAVPKASAATTAITTAAAEVRDPSYAAA
jgi:ABC-type enterochelin transport system substrate-binding protein